MPAVTLDAVLKVAPYLPGDLQGAALLETATQWCEGYCGRKFDHAVITGERGRTVRDDVAGRIRHVIYPARPPVTGVTSVKLNGSAITDYELLDDGGRAERILLETEENVPGWEFELDYTGGWTPANVPATLVLAVATLMGRLLDRTQTGAVATESSGGESAGYLSAGQLYEDIRTLLAPYRLRRL